MPSMRWLGANVDTVGGIGSAIRGTSRGSRVTCGQRSPRRLRAGESAGLELWRTLRASGTVADS